MSTTESQNFADLGKMAAIAKLYEGSGYAPVTDSCAFAPGKDGECALASALLQEGIDFDLTYFPLRHLGWKSVVLACGELIARLARPSALHLTLGVSSKLDFAQVKTLWSGIVAAAKDYGVLQLGLNLVPSINGLTISVSALGETRGSVLGGRIAPRSKDLIAVSGSLGAAYLGFRILEREKKHFLEKKDNHLQPDLEQWKMLIGAYLKPESGAGIPDLFEKSGIIPSAGLWVTDGLADAVKRLTLATGLGAKVYADRIPFEANSFAIGKEMDIDPVSAAMNGGGDLRLMLVIPISRAEDFRHDFQTFDIIGHLALSDVGAVLVTPEGAELPLHAPGWKEEEDN